MRGICDRCEPSDTEPPSSASRLSKPRNPLVLVMAREGDCMMTLCLICLLEGARALVDVDA